VNLSEAATNLELYSNSVCSAAISSATAGVSGANSITTGSLAANGTTTIFAQATDIAGNVGSCSAMTVYTHDGVNPTVASVSASSNDGTYGVGTGGPGHAAPRAAALDRWCHRHELTGHGIAINQN
jgi:hypothetical protein